MPEIDILVSQGGQGGVENVVNRTAVYLQEHGWRVRILQFADTGYHWTDHRIEWYSFWTHEKKIEFDPIIEEIKEFYRGSGTPDIVLATTWPLLNTVAAIIRGEIGASYKIGSWMHAALKKYDDYGWGGARELSAADFHLAINREIETEIRADIPDAVIYAVNNPIEMERIRFSDKRDPKQFAVVCRLDPLKNVIQVVKAMEHLDGDARLHVVGTGDEYGNILAYIEENGLTDRVVLHGWKDDPWELLKNAGTLVSASEEETGPLVAVEALLCGMPVIASRVGGIPEWIRDGVNGFGFAVYDYHAMEEYMEQIAEGRMPIPDARICRDSVAQFRDDVPLRELESILQVAINS